MTTRMKMKATSRSKALLTLKSMLGLSTEVQKDQFAALKKMIGKYIADMKQEQKDDDKHKEWCNKEIDMTEDATKLVQETVDTHNQKINEKNTELESIKEAYKQLKKDLEDLDVAMMIATAQRKKEKSEYDQIISEITISLSLLKKARDKMASFYEKDSLVQRRTQPKNENPTNPANAFAQVEDMFGFDDQASSAGGHQKQSGAATKILGMLDEIRTDLKVEQKTVEMEEKHAIEDYEKTMADSKESKEAKEKDVIAKEGAMSRIAEEVAVEKNGLDQATDEMLSLKDKMTALHDSCDFLLENYDIRKKARASEIEGLQKSIAILSGANFDAAAASFLQVKSALNHHLRRKMPAVLEPAAPL